MQSTTFPPLHSRDWLDLQVGELARHAFRTNDILEIDLASRIVSVNGARLCGLKAHDFILLLVLAEAAFKRPGLPVSTTDLLVRIEEVHGRKDGLSWVDPTAKDVHQAASRLRQAIAAAGMNRQLLETIRGHGYRLSTPRMNIVGVKSADTLFNSREA